METQSLEHILEKDLPEKTEIYINTKIQEK